MNDVASLMYLPFDFRLSEICIKRFPSSSCKEIGEKIHITVELTADSLLERYCFFYCIGIMYNLLKLRLDFCEKIISAKLPGCKLIIIDSIGCIAKKQFYQSLIERSRFMMKLTAKLKNLAVQYGLAVCIMNYIIKLINLHLIQGCGS